MALAAARIRDMCTGHSGYPPRMAVQGSTDFFINGRQSHRQGDKWGMHYKGLGHDGILASGSPNVFVNGKQQGRVTDPISCGSRVATGSPDFFVD